MVSLELVAVIVSAAVVFVAYTVRGMSGFSTSLVAMPILVHVRSIHTAVPMMSSLALVAMLLPLMWLGNRIGERITSTISPQVFSRVLAAVLFAAGVSLLLK